MSDVRPLTAKHALATLRVAREERPELAAIWMILEGGFEAHEMTIRELKAALEEERRKFQAETLRTSALTQLLIRAEAILCPDHEPGAWSRNCERCAVVADSRKLRATPINAAALTSTEAPNE